VKTAKATKIQIEELINLGDQRGPTYNIPEQALKYLGRVANVHFGLSKPGAVRGNHYHLRRREALVVFPGQQWSLHWDEGDGSAPQQRSFDGTRAVLVLLEAGASHAVRNDGRQPLWLMACSSEPYDPAETVMRKLA
jgi:dTDP-4-dehydrorhamnose 3,5-epimerase-like enzyme